MLKAYKYRLYPNKDQQDQIDKTIGCCRLVYNLALETKKTLYEYYGVKVSAIDLCYQLVELKNAYTWLKEVDSQALQAAVKKIDVSYKNFFRGAGFPKFKSGKRGVQSFQVPNNARRIDWANNTITLPKLKNVPIVLSRTFIGDIKTCTVSRTPTGKYYISILVDNKIQLPDKPTIKESTAIGIDVGISNYVVDSNERVFEPNRKLKENLKRLKALQRRVSRKSKGSNNRKKAGFRLALLHEKIGHQRLDYIHKVTHTLVHDNQVESIIIEDLNVSGILKNHKIAQAMTDVSIGKLLAIIKYKCEWYGKNLIMIGRFDPSSKRCSNCGFVNNKLTLQEREWRCVECNTTHDRDKNAAINIKYFGLQQSVLTNDTPVGSREEPVELSAIAGAMKQENIQGGITPNCI